MTICEIVLISTRKVAACNLCGARLLDSLRGANLYLLAFCVVASYGCYALRLCAGKSFSAISGRRTSGALPDDLGGVFPPFSCWGAR